MIKNNYTGKTLEEAINNAKIALQETEDNLYIRLLHILRTFPGH